MLQKEHRLIKKKDFAEVFKTGYPLQGGDMLFLKVLKKYSDNIAARFGFIVSLKVSKKAVIRNQIKRRLREIVRLKIKNNEIKNGFDIIIIAKPAIVGKKYSEIKDILESVLKKL